MATVGAINPYPTVEVIFTTLARTAIQMGERGILVLLVDDTTSTEKWTELKSVADINTEKWTERNAKLIESAFSVFPPSKVKVRRTNGEEIQTILKELESLKFTQLAVIQSIRSEEDLVTITNWAKGPTNKRNVVFTTTLDADSDSCNVVALGNKIVTHKYIDDYTADEFCVMIAGAMAGIPLNRSLDNIVFGDIVKVDDVEPENGVFLMYNDDDKVRCKLAINNKVTFDSTYSSSTRYIKIWEGMNILKFDIEDTFKDYWQGLYLNSYDNKLAFCDNVTKVYFAELEPNVLSADYDNRLDIDIEANKRHIILDGKDPDKMTETEIRTYPTGESVYLIGDDKFQNTMINLSLTVNYQKGVKNG